MLDELYRVFREDVFYEKRMSAFRELVDLVIELVAVIVYGLFKLSVFLIGMSYVLIVLFRMFGNGEFLFDISVVEVAFILLVFRAICDLCLNGAGDVKGRFTLLWRLGVQLGYIAIAFILLMDCYGELYESLTGNEDWFDYFQYQSNVFDLISMSLIFSGFLPC